VDLRWDQVDFDRAVLHVRRVRQGTPSVHPLSGPELRALRRLQRESDASPFVFISERRAPFTTAGFARMIERALRLPAADPIPSASGHTAVAGCPTLFAGYVRGGSLARTRPYPTPPVHIPGWGLPPHLW
jgi:integrase